MNTEQCLSGVRVEIMIVSYNLFSESDIYDNIHGWLAKLRALFDPVFTCREQDCICFINEITNPATRGCPFN